MKKQSLHPEGFKIPNAFFKEFEIKVEGIIKKSAEAVSNEIGLTKPTTSSIDISDIVAQEKTEEHLKNDFFKNL